MEKEHIHSPLSPDLEGNIEEIRALVHFSFVLDRTQIHYEKKQT